MMDLPKCPKNVQQWLIERELVPVWDYMLEELILANRLKDGEYADIDGSAEFGTKQRAWGAYNALLVIASHDDGDGIWHAIYRNVKWYVR